MTKKNCMVKIHKISSTCGFNSFCLIHIKYHKILKRFSILNILAGSECRHESEVKKITRESEREVRGGGLGEIRVDLYVVGIPEGSKGIDPHLLDNI